MSPCWERKCDMNKLTKKQIEKIIAHTPQELKGTQPGGGALRDILGYFMPADANWSFVAGWLHTGELVVIRYGEVM